MKKLVKNIPLYGGKLVVAVGEDLEKLGKEFKVNFDSETNLRDCKAIMFEAHYGKYPAYYIFFDDLYKKAHDTISHEALHATNRVLNHVGVNASHTNDEAQAYLLGWIVKNIYEFIEKEYK